MDRQVRLVQGQNFDDIPLFREENLSTDGVFLPPGSGNENPASTVNLPHDVSHGCGMSRGIREGYPEADSVAPDATPHAHPKSASPFCAAPPAFPAGNSYSIMPANRRNSFTLPGPNPA